MKVTVKILQGSECNLEVSERAVFYALLAGRREKERREAKRDN